MVFSSSYILIFYYTRPAFAGLFLSFARDFPRIIFEAWNCQNSRKTAVFSV